MGTGGKKYEKIDGRWYRFQKRRLIKPGVWEEDRVGAPKLTDEFMQNTLRGELDENEKFDDKPPVGHVPVYDIEQSHKYKVKLDKANCKKCGNVVKWSQGYKLCENIIKQDQEVNTTFAECKDVDDPLRFVSPSGRSTAKFLPPTRTKLAKRQDPQMKCGGTLERVIINVESSNLKRSDFNTFFEKLK